MLSLYFRTEGKGNLHLAFQATQPAGTESNEFAFTCNGTTRKVHVTAPGTYDIGTFDVPAPGYVRVDIQGNAAKPARAQFYRIPTFYADGTALSGELNFTPEDKVDDSYWYRRGPSVHLFYDFPEGDAEWFYNEATVPEEGSVPATYYMLTGFKEGYMGIQTHTDGPNTVLFSVWSPYQTDNPGAIPEDMRIQTLRKGAGVTAQDFGGEGSGGQSFMDYPWKPGTAYGTLVHVHPDGKGNTDYTGGRGRELAPAGLFPTPAYRHLVSGRLLLPGVLRPEHQHPHPLRPLRQPVGPPEGRYLERSDRGPVLL